MCCTPYVATIVAGVLCVFQSFANLCWNVPLIIGFSMNKTEVMTLTPIDIEELENPFMVYGIAIIVAIANVQLVVFSCLLLKANRDMKTEWITAWCILILLKSMFSVSIGIYFLYEYGNDHLQRVALFRLAALFSGIFFFWPVINLALFILVFRRYRDIMNSHLLVSRVDEILRDDTQPPPYTPGSFISGQQISGIDPAQITGWSRQPLLNFDHDDTVLVAGVS